MEAKYVHVRVFTSKAIIYALEKNRLCSNPPKPFVLMPEPTSNAVERHPKYQSENLLPLCLPAPGICMSCCVI